MALELLSPGQQPHGKRICDKCHVLLGRDPSTLGGWVDLHSVRVLRFLRQIRRCSFCFKRRNVLQRYLAFVHPGLLEKHWLLHEMYFAEALEKKSKKGSK